MAGERDNQLPVGTTFMVVLVSYEEYQSPLHARVVDEKHCGK